jgi:hypothetical protein
MLKFEYEQRVLKPQQCFDLVTRVKNIGMKVYHLDMSKEVTKDHDPEIPSPPIELFARRYTGSPMQVNATLAHSQS